MWLKAVGVIDIPDSTDTLFDHGAFEPRSRRVFVAHTARDRVEVIDHETSRHLTTLHGFPEAAGVVADEGQVLVTNRGAAGLAWIDAHTLETRAVFDTGPRPNGVAIVSRLKLAVVACIGDETHGPVLQALDLESHRRWGIVFQWRIRADLPALSSRPTASLPAWLFVVLTRIGLIIVVRKAFFSRDLPASNNARLQVSDHEIDFVGRQRAGSRLQILWPSARRAPVTLPRRVCAVIKCGHTGANSPLSGNRRLPGLHPRTGHGNRHNPLSSRSLNPPSPCRCFAQMSQSNTQEPQQRRPE